MRNRVYIFWLPDTKNWLTGKDPDAGKDWRQEEKGMTEDEMVGWHHQLPELAQTHVHWVGDVIQPSRPLSSPFSPCLRSFPASGSFPMSWLFTSSGQSIEASASASVLPMNIQDWFPLGLTGLISLLSKGFSRVFSSSTIRKHQFSSAQPSLSSSSHICTLLLEKP